MNTVLSFLLSRIVERNFRKEDVDHTLNLLLDSGFFPTIKSVTIRKFKNKTKYLKIFGPNQFILDFFYNLAEGGLESISNDDILNLHNKGVYSHCKREDNKKTTRR